MNYNTVKSLIVFYIIVFFIFKDNEGDCLLTTFFLFIIFFNNWTQRFSVHDSLTNACLMPSEWEKGYYGINCTERCSQCSTPGQTCDNQYGECRELKDQTQNLCVKVNVRIIEMCSINTLKSPFCFFSQINWPIVKVKKKITKQWRWITINNNLELCDIYNMNTIFWDILSSLTKL